MERPIYIPVEESLEKFYDVAPPVGYVKPENFPNCCLWHSSSKEVFEKWYAKFPYCCEYHEKMLKSSFGFNKEWYAGVIDKLLNQLSYTEQVIKEKIDAGDWYEDITDYFEYNIDSFGKPSVGGSKYIEALQQLISSSQSIPDEKKHRLLEYWDTQINESQKPENKLQPGEINRLLDLYERWVKAFPFSLSYFQPYEKFFKQRWIILSSDQRVNRYSNQIKGRILTQQELIHFLNRQTDKLLQIVNTLDLYEKGEISNSQQIRIDIAKEQYKIGQKQIFKEYDKGERRYLKTIKSWLKNELALFKELECIDKPTPSKFEPSKSDILKKRLQEYGFQDVGKVKKLNNEQYEQLIKFLAEGKLPYQIAMLDYLGFLTHMKKTHCTTNEIFFKRIAEILNTNKRAVSGNYYTLSNYTTENKSRYTAHLHIETVEKDYKSIK